MKKKLVLEKIKDADLRLSISKLLDAVILVSKKNEITKSHFLTPTELSTILDIVKNEEVVYKVFGGSNDCERNKIIFAPIGEEENVLDNDFGIGTIEIKYNEKFAKELKHGDILGSVLGLGLNRDMVGDIIINSGSCLVFVDDTIADYVVTNLTKVGRTTVTTNIYQSQIIDNEPKLLIEQRTSISSIRLDCLLSKVFNVSRGDVKTLIGKEKAFINFVVATDSSKQLKDGDIITLRGYGRVKYLCQNGISKKGKINISYYKYGNG